METEDTVPEAIKFCSNTAIRRKPLTEPAPTTRQSRKLHQSCLLKRINSATKGRCQEGSSQEKDRYGRGARREGGRRVDKAHWPGGSCNLRGATGH